MSNKDAAILFLKMTGSGDVRTAYEKFIADSFIHHNQYFSGDRESLMQAMEEASKISPNKSIEVKKIYEDGNTVITHSLVTRQNANEASIVVVHIFRFETHKVVELWDVGQQLSKDSPNQNGAF